MKLTPQHKRILEMLEDGNYHCPTLELFMKDDRKRISELNKGGYTIIGDKICTNSEHHHTSPVKLRRLISSPDIIPISNNPIVQKFFNDFTPKKVEQPTGMMNF